MSTAITNQVTFSLPPNSVSGQPAKMPGAPIPTTIVTVSSGPSPIAGAQHLSSITVEKPALKDIAIALCNSAGLSINTYKRTALTIGVATASTLYLFPYITQATNTASLPQAPISNLPTDQISSLMTRQVAQHIFKKTLAFIGKYPKEGALTILAISSLGYTNSIYSATCNAGQKILQTGQKILQTGQKILGYVQSHPIIVSMACVSILANIIGLRLYMYRNSSPTQPQQTATQNIAEMIISQAQTVEIPTILSVAPPTTPMPSADLVQVPQILLDTIAPKASEGIKIEANAAGLINEGQILAVRVVTKLPSVIIADVSNFMEKAAKFCILTIHKTYLMSQKSLQG